VTGGRKKIEDLYRDFSTVYIYMKRHYEYSYEEKTDGFNLGEG
jgi:hypothetical protein